MLTRRYLFKLGFLANFSNLFVSGVGQAQARPIADIEAGMRALVDTIVPADESPGAVALGVDRMLFSRIRKNANYLKVITETFDALDKMAVQQSDLSFAKLDLAQRSSIISRVLNSRKQFPEASRQIGALRTQVLTEFYASGLAFTMLDYHPPSQGGYPDYARIPVDAS